MTRSSATPAWQTAIVILASTVVGVVALVWLYWAQAVCIPIALAVFLTFVLSPLVTLLQRWGLGRVFSVLIPVVAAALVLGAIVWMVAAQARTMASEVPKYAENIREKIRSVRTLGQSPLTRRLESTAREIADESQLSATSSVDKAAGNASKPQVLVQPGMPSWLAFLPALLGRLAEALGGLVMAFVLLIFMLLKRDDLRNRLIRLFGHGRLTTTTKVLDDAGQRISRYLVVQLAVNGICGLTLSLGMLAIGLPYAFLWGVSAFVLRYIPYIGVWVAALAPVLLSLAVFEGWIRPLVVLALFAGVEFTTGNVIEPRLYGRSVGVSEIAFLVAAACGAFLWGPIGIILSSPAIVCLVVMGKYIPFLKFLDILLGDEPVLTNDVAYYQRLLARNRDEAQAIVAARLKESSLQHVFDEILIPALRYLKRDRARGELTEESARSALETMAEMAEAVGVAGPADPAKDDVAPFAVEGRAYILAFPAHDEADRLALVLLRRLLDPHDWQVEILTAGTLASELIARVAKQRPALVCIGAVLPGEPARARYVCTRLRTSFPEIKLVVGRWGLRRGLRTSRERLRRVGVHFVAATLADTRSQLHSLLPTLVWQQSQGLTLSGRDSHEPQSLENVGKK